MYYLVSYELQDPRRNGAAVEDALRDLGAKPVMGTQWLVRAPGTRARLLGEPLAAVLEPRDRLLVVRMTDEADGFAHNVTIRSIDF